MKTRIPFCLEDGGGTGEGDDASKQYEDASKQQAVNRGMDIGQVKVKNKNTC